MIIKRYDLRHLRSQVIKTKHARGKVIVRRPQDVNAVTVHQMAVEFGVTPGRIRRAGGDRHLALAHRALGIACHGAAFRFGQSVLACPLTWYVQHGNAHNVDHIGYEIDGRHPGREDDPTTTPVREDLRSTWGGPPTAWTDLLIDTARDGLVWLVETAWEEGMPIEWLDAHRQSSGMRRSDPGERIWRAVVLDIAALLRLKTRPAQVWPATSKAGPGRPIPPSWDPDGVGSY